MKHIVVLGAGIGGLTAAYDMRALLKSGEKVTVVSENPYFQFTPSNPWLAVNWRTPNELKVPLAPSVELRS